MKIHLDWIRVTAAAVFVTAVGVQPAVAQYAPYRPIPQQPTAAASHAQPPHAQPHPQQAPITYPGITPTQPMQTPYTAWNTPQTAAPQTVAPQPVTPYRPAAPAGPQYPQTTAPYVPSVPYAPTTAAAPSQTQYGYAGYPALARQQNAPTPAQSETLPPPQGATNGHYVPNGQAMPSEYSNGHPVNGHANGHASGYPTHAYPGHDGHGCYPGYTDCSVSNYLDNSCYSTQWFGGVYFLFMERDNATPKKLTIEVDHDAVTHPYYPPATTTVVSTHQTDHPYREGVEVRFGSTFTIGDQCGSCNSCAPVNVFAWEVAWWGIGDGEECSTYVDTMPSDRQRTYGMKSFVGLQYNRDGGGVNWRPVNDYYGYELPVPDPGAPPYNDGDVVVLAQRVRTNFRASNLELNFIRFPVCDFGCGGCNTGCDPCAPPCPTGVFSMYGSCGVRYFRVRDDFRYGSEFAEWTGGAGGGWDMSYGGFNGDNNELYYDIHVDNHLIGPQVGWTMNYCYNCKWNFFCNSTFGVFNNYIEHCQQMWSGGGGDIRFAGSGENFYVKSNKNDLAFLGELRLGGAYDITCNCRAVAAYRAVAVAGLATSTDQMKDEYSNADWVAIIDSDNSMIVHGIQLGGEFRY